MAGNWNPIDSDDEFENDAANRFSGKAALLLMIDASPQMFQKWEGADDNAAEMTPFLAALKCSEAIWRSKVISNQQDLVGILLVGTEQSKNESGFSNLYELQELSSVKVEMIQELIEMKNSETLNGFEEKIGSSEAYDMKEAFWMAKMIFDKKKTSTFVKKLLYFTCEDNPNAGKPNLQKDAVIKFKDLGKVEFNVVTFKKDFQFEKFYSNLLEDRSNVIFSENLESLTRVIRMKERLKRPMSRTTLEITPGMKIGVGIYSFVRPSLKPKHVLISKRDNEVIERNVNVFRSDSGMPVLKSEERKIVTVQGEQAVFTPQEVKEIKYVKEPGITVVGFLNLETFNHFCWYRSPGYFMYPDEEKVSGSKDFFTALLRRCDALKKVVLVSMVLSRGKTPKLACLLPSFPNTSGENTIFPQGFHVFPVPFSDEIRKYDLQALGQTGETTPELVNLMQTVVKKLKNKSFDLLDVKNPSLHSFWKKLEEEALGEQYDASEEFFDYTEPNEQLMKQRLGHLPTLIQEDLVTVGANFSNMRSAGATTARTVDIPMEARHGRLSNLTCEVLKNYIISVGKVPPVRPTKAVLVRIILNHLGLELV